MALIKCSECGKEISDKAKVCPNCANPIFKKKVSNMKKKKWEELIWEEKEKIIAYRKQKKQWYIGFRPLYILFCLFALFPLLILVFVPFMFFVNIIISTIFLILEYVCWDKARNEDKIWYEKNIDELYENEILK